MTKFIKLRPSEIVFDPRFNRDLDEARVKSMAKGFDRDLLGVPLISERADGTRVVIDAQHRVATCRLRGFDEPLLCEVHTGLTLAEEAALYLKINGNRTAIRAFDKFKARLVARDPEALAIAQIVEGSGLRISKCSGKRSVCAIQVVVGVYRKGNLAPTLSVLLAWSGGEAEYFEGTLLRAVSLFLSKYPEVSLPEFLTKLSGHSAERVISKLQRVRGAFSDVPYEIAACSVFRDIYNTRRGKKLPPLTTA